MMKKTTLIIILIASVAGISAIMKEDGRAGATGSPGETTCNTTQCHNNFTLNSGGGSIAISSPNLNNWVYSPGQVYQIDVTVSKLGVNLFGLGFEALRSTGANGGTLSITNSTETQIKSAFISGNIRANVVHKLNGGASADTKTFSFNWTAPNSNIGNITFYAAGNASNDNGTAAGDYIYTTSQVVTFATGVDDVATSNKIGRIYPNPVSDQMKIAFTMLEHGQVEFNLYNLQGSFVCNLVKSEYAQGNHESDIRIHDNVEPGVYLVELKTADARSLKKIVKLN